MVMIKKSILALLTVACIAALVSFTNPPKEQVLKTVIIDAGHGIMPGGGHNGAKGTYSYEDDICYAVSKKLVDMLSKEFPDIKIIESRPTKNIVDLHERADLANRSKGDLFISIHVNAMPNIQKKEANGFKTVTSYVGKGKKRKKTTRKVQQWRYYEVPNTTAKGTQTYVWGAHKGDDKEVAVRENAPMLAEDNYKEKYGDIDVNSPEFIALSLVKTQQFGRRSSTLAGLVEDEFSKAGRVSGGSKQRAQGIWVLQATAMPAILVETGFITNPQEEDYLNSDAGQNEIAQSVTNALKNYKSWLEKKQLANTEASNVPSNPNNKTQRDQQNAVALLPDSKLRPSVR